MDIWQGGLVDIGSEGKYSNYTAPEKSQEVF